MRSFVSLAIALLLAAWPSSGATFVVNKFTDDNGPCTPDDCSVREAVLAANLDAAFDEIYLPAGIHRLSIQDPGENQGFAGDLDLRAPAALIGASFGETHLVGDGTDGVLNIFPVLGWQIAGFSLENLVIRGGRSTGIGGALTAEGALSLTIRNCRFEDNMTVAAGGAIFAINVPTRVENSVFVNNRAGSGGAIYFATANFQAPLTIESTTFVDNSTNGWGGAIYLISEGVTTLRNVTFSNNPGFLGRAIFTFERAFNLHFENTLLTNGCRHQNGGGATSLGGNFEGGGDTCGLTHATDLVAVADLGLGAPEYDGSTLVLPLLAGSPAIDSVTNCPPRDQRGAPRPQDGDGDGVARCDAGAYELGGVAGLADIPALAPGNLVFLALLLASLGLWRLRHG